MIERPLLLPLFYLGRTSAGEAAVLTTAGQVRLVGRLFGLVVPLMNGYRTDDEIVDALAAEASAAEICYTLLVLEREGCLVDAQVDAQDERRPHAALPAPASPGSSSPHISIALFGDLPDAEFRSHLSELGVQIDDRGDLLVVLTDDYLLPRLSDPNREALRDGHPWLLCKPAGHSIWVGPLFQPGKSACWECLAARLRANLQNIPVPGPKSTYAIVPTSALRAAARLVAESVAEWMHGRYPARAALLRSLDAETMETSSHVVVRRPQCPSCGERLYRSSRHAEPLILQRQNPEASGYAASGDLRPTNEFARLARHISPITGVVSGLQRVSGHGDPVQVYLATSCPPLTALSGSQPHRTLAGGKGWSDSRARTSAVCEAVERYSSYFQGYEPRIRGSLDSLGMSAIHPNRCLLFSERQLELRERSDDFRSRFGFVPEPFDPGFELDWTPVWSLTRQDWRYLPAQLCYRNYPRALGHTFCRADSNGSAAGVTLEEAVVQGFLELVERDAVAVWWYNRLRRPRIELGDLHDSRVAELEDYYADRGRDFWVLDISTDLEIPACVAVSRRIDCPQEELIMGFGAAFDAPTAVMHALAEMTQLLLPASRWSTMDESELVHVDPGLRHWLKTATITAQAYLAPDLTSEFMAHSLDRQVGRAADDNLKRCLEIVEKHDMELLVLSQTRPDIGLPVVKVVVPGLRHFWPRFAPGRLYDVPVRLGWLERQLSEDELNPIPLFL